MNESRVHQHMLASPTGGIYCRLGEAVVCSVGLSDICRPPASIVCPDWTWGASFILN